jgi:hypothetical protein
MLDMADLGGDRVEVDVADLGLGRDLVGRGLRDDAKLGLRQRERGLEVVPGLDTIFVVEHRAQLVGAPHVLEQDRVEDAGCHGSSAC